MSQTPYPRERLRERQKRFETPSTRMRVSSSYQQRMDANERLCLYGVRRRTQAARRAGSWLVAASQTVILSDASTIS